MPASPRFSKVAISKGSPSKLKRIIVTSVIAASTILACVFGSKDIKFLDMFQAVVNVVAKFATEE